jgi:hypothetical protein
MKKNRLIPKGFVVIAAYIFLQFLRKIVEDVCCLKDQLILMDTVFSIWQKDRFWFELKLKKYNVKVFF